MRIHVVATGVEALYVVSYSHGRILKSFRDHP